MKIVPVKAEHAEDLLAIYRAQVAGAPHCRFIPEPGRFYDELLGNVSLPTNLFHPMLQSKLFVAEGSSGKAEGFAAWVKYKDEDKRECEAITGLFFANEAAGDALVLACEAEANGGELDAFPCHHGGTRIHTYNAGWDGLSDRIPHVAKLLVRHGYRPFIRELQLIAPTIEPPLREVALAPGLHLAHMEEVAGQDGAWLVLAMEGEQEVGICLYSTLAALAEGEEASQIGYVWWLHVNETQRQRGIARVLMAATFEQLRLRGCTSCWLTTASENWRAQPLYYSLGFDIVDGAASFRKVLKTTAPI